MSRGGPVYAQRESDQRRRRCEGAGVRTRRASEIGVEWRLTLVEILSLSLSGSAEEKTAVRWEDGAVRECDLRGRARLVLCVKGGTWCMLGEADRERAGERQWAWRDSEVGVAMAKTALMLVARCLAQGPSL